MGQPTTGTSVLRSGRSQLSRLLVIVILAGCFSCGDETSTPQGTQAKGKEEASASAQPPSSLQTLSDLPAGGTGSIQSDFLIETTGVGNGIRGGTRGEDVVIQPPAPQFKIAAAKGNNLYVFVINPASDKIVRINADTRHVDTIQVPGLPEELEITPDNKTAVVLSPSSNTVSLIDTASAKVESLAVRPGLNRMLLTLDGRFGLAYFDFAKAAGKIDINGIRTFNEISIVNIAARTTTSINVETSPAEIELSDDSTKAFVVTNTKIMVVQLDTAAMRPIPFSDNPLVTIQPRAVDVTGDGTRAFLLPRDKKQVHVLDLITEERTLITPFLAPVGLMLAPDDSALLLTHDDISNFTRMDTSPPFTDTTVTVPGIHRIDTIAFAPDGSRAVLFGAATFTEMLTIYDLRSWTATSFFTMKPIRSARFSSDPRYAILTTQGGDGDPLDNEDSFYDGVPAYVALNVESAAQSTTAADSDVEDIVFDSTGRYAFVSLKNNSTAAVVDMKTPTTSTKLTFPAVPRLIGTLPTRPVGFALFTHELGQISFVDLEGRQHTINTITGFELNSRLRE